MNDIQILNTYSDVSSGVSLANYKQILTQWRGLRVNQPLILQIDGEHLDDQQVILLLILLKLFRIDLLDNNMIIFITDSHIKVIERQCRYQSSINNVKVSWLWCHIGLYAMHIGYNTLCGDYQVADLQEYNVMEGLVQLWEVELLFLVYYVSNYILKYFATSNADDKFQQIISSWRLFMNYSLTQEGQKYDFDRIRPQSTIQSRYLIFQKGKIEITTCIKRTAMTKINAVEDVQGRSTNSLNKLRQF
ncbi:Hypothetical_protein [Hexamita inflata]|uniref:Hypothetical_protein n=1 Tax=Hexamita inflata TaxID=28002 RepID=A0AA86UIG8_9EUKA|nr:Hypothetical protein HINF_LOCUS40441 [Hexamita inflata]